MKSKRRREIIRPKVHIPSDTNFADELLVESDETYYDVFASGADFSKTDYEDLTFEQSVFRKICFDNTILKYLTLRDVVVDRCSAANASWQEAIFKRVEINTTRLTGLNCMSANWQDTLVLRCKCNFANFRFSTLANCRFDECDLREADFHGADLRGTVFSHCDMRQVEMSQAQMTDTDLRGSEIEGISMNADDARGIIVEPSQAEHFASLLGIQLKYRISTEEEN